MKKLNKQVNQKQKQSILNASRMLKQIKNQFDGNNDVHVEKYNLKSGLRGLFNKSGNEFTFMEVKGFRVANGSKVDALQTISPEFLQEVSNFLENEPNNEYAQKITKTLVKGVQFE